MILGYNTNGLADVDPIQAIELLHDIGYAGIALSLDHGILNPFADNFESQLDQTAERLHRISMRSVIETGARFLLDPQVKHEPTLLTADPDARARRIDFLCRAIDIAAALDADCVSLWSGRVHDGAGDREVMGRLVAGLAETLAYAELRGVPIAFEPEPDMFIGTMRDYAKLLDELTTRRVDLGHMKLTVDLGHLHCQGEVPIADQLSDWADHLINIHIEDMRAGKHEHLMFGEGEIDFPPILAALA